MKNKKSVTRTHGWSKCVLVVFLLCIVQSNILAANYSRVNEPPVPPAFIPLPPGAVHPEGWLLDWCNTARDGITGFSDTVNFTEKGCSKSKGANLNDVFRVGWTGTAFTGYGGDDWGLEQCGYWLDGLTRLALVLQDSVLLKKVKTRLDMVVSHSTAGKSFAWWSPGWAYNWPSANLARALVAYYEATKDPAVLKTLETAYNGFPAGATTFSRNESNLESMLEAYSLGASNTLLTKALSIYQSCEGQTNGWANNSVSAVHGVTWNERSKLPVIGYPWANKIAYLNASVNCYNWAETNHMLPFGVMSSSESLNGIGAFKSTESCDVSDYTCSVLWLYRVTGSKLYGDWLERAVFNAAPQTTSRDFKTHVYFQAPNRIDTLNPGNASPNPNAGSQPQFYLPSHFPQCCTGNLTRIVPNYVIHMWMATYDNGLAATLYGPCKVSALAGDKVPVVLTCATNYPFDESVKITVTPSSAAAFPLYFKIPGWCANAKILVNGTASVVTPDAKGFAKISRTWTSGDIVDITFPMRPRIAKYGASGNSPALAVYCGPLLFALPIAETNNNLSGSATNWKYALDFSAQDSVIISRSSIPSKWNWSSDAPMTLSVPAVSASWGPGALPSGFSSGSTKASIKLVPYGCAKFRVSMFPVTQQAYSMSEYLPFRGGATSINPGFIQNETRQNSIASLHMTKGNLVFKGAKATSLVITNVKGQVVYATKVQGSLQGFSIGLKQQKLINGTYIVSVYNKDQVVQQQKILLY